MLRQLLAVALLAVQVWTATDALGTSTFTSPRALSIHARSCSLLLMDLFVMYT